VFATISYLSDIYVVKPIAFVFFFVELVVEAFRIKVAFLAVYPLDAFSLGSEPAL
jgi:hypothetical protein